MGRMATYPLSADGLHEQHEACGPPRDGYAIDRCQFQLPATSEQAYAVQHETIALSCYGPCEYKVGSTSNEAQALLGTSGSGLAAVEAEPARDDMAPSIAQRFGDLGILGI